MGLRVMCKEGISLHRSPSGEPEGMFLHRELRLTVNAGSRNGVSPFGTSSKRTWSEGCFTGAMRDTQRKALETGISLSLYGANWGI